MATAGTRALFARKGALPFLAGTTYVAIAALRAAGADAPHAVAVGLVAITVALVSVRRTKRLSVELWGLSLVVASLGAPSAAGRGWLDAFGLVGAAVATVFAHLALGKMVAPPGLGHMPRVSPLPGAALLVLGWLLAVCAAVSDALGRAGFLAAHAREVGAGACVSASIALAVIAWRAGVRRRFELGILARAHAVSAIGSLMLGAAIFLSVTGGGAADRVLRVHAAVVACVASAIALHGDAAAIARQSRRALALMLTAGPILFLGASVALDAPRHSAIVVLLAGGLSLLLGTGVKWLEGPLRPAQGALLDAIDKAEQMLLRAEPEEALREALVALRGQSGPARSIDARGAVHAPEIWMLEPSRVFTIDAAGYAHEREGSWPDDLAKVAAAEPCATLRTEVLSSLEVRRADLRPLLAWMLERDALLATVITREGEAEGLLVVPAVGRTEPLSLEEVRAIKRLSDSMAAICHVRSALARGMSRERALLARIDEADESVAHLAHDVALHVGRNAQATMRLARPATVGVYSAASSAAYEALERRLRANAPFSILAPTGVDPAPYIARAHLAGPRSAEPLVLVDGTASREHDLARWNDPLASPLALADRGLLVLLDGAALPLDVQQLVARSLAERRAPWERAEPLDVAFGLTGVTMPKELMLAGRLDHALASRLGDAAESSIALPTLGERPEDIRAIVTDRLAREGMRVKGTPVGIEDAAFAILVEYPFFGEDAELSAIVQRLVARCTGLVIRAADVEALGLIPRPQPYPSEQQRRPRLV